jgi:hypothetical protein
MTILSILGMRNYFAHHPWMALPVLMVGLVLSMEQLLKLPHASLPAEVFLKRNARWIGPGVVACGLVYGCAVTFMMQANATELNGLMTFIRQHTPRNAILLIPENESWLANNTERLNSILDRKMAAPAEVAGSPSMGQPSATPTYLLTTGSLPAPQELVAKYSRADTDAPQFTEKLLH